MTCNSGVTVRVFAPIGKKNQCNFALDLTLRTLPYYEQFFGVKYPLPKLDLVALAEHPTEAMENW